MTRAGSRRPVRPSPGLSITQVTRDTSLSDAVPPYCPGKACAIASERSHERQRVHLQIRRVSGIVAESSKTCLISRVVCDDLAVSPARARWSRLGYDIVARHTAGGRPQAADGEASRTDRFEIDTRRSNCAEHQFCSLDYALTSRCRPVNRCSASAPDPMACVSERAAFETFSRTRGAAVMGASF